MFYLVLIWRFEETQTNTTSSILLQHQKYSETLIYVFLILRLARSGMFWEIKLVENTRNDQKTVVGQQAVFSLPLKRIIRRSSHRRRENYLLFKILDLIFLLGEQSLFC